MDKLHRFFQDQYGVVTRGQAHIAGFSDRKIETMLRSKAWLRPHRGVYVSAAAATSVEQAISAACLAVGTTAVASHRSAAWLWDLIDEPPSEVELIVARASSIRLAGAHLFRPRDVGELHVVTQRRLPVTNPLRTLVDLASVVDADALDAAIDKAVSSRIITVRGVAAELQRRSRHGRAGLGLLRGRLEARGLDEGPGPSVLESMTHRFLRRIEVGWTALEVRLFGGRYRVDVQLAPGAMLEVDGYRYHWSPEAKAADEERRRVIRQTGARLSVLDWYQIAHRQSYSERVVRELLADAEQRPQGLHH
jgi:hypothetical protein